MNTTQNTIIALYHCVFSGATMVTEFDNHAAKELYDTLPNLWAISIASGDGASSTLDAVLFIKTNMTAANENFGLALAAAISQIPALSNLPHKGTRLIPNELAAPEQPAPADYLRIAMERYAAVTSGGQIH